MTGEGFSEQTLGQAIKNTWGEHGAHFDVYQFLLVQNAKYRAALEEIRDCRPFEHNEILRAVAAKALEGGE